MSQAQTPPPGPIISIRGLVKQFGRFAALRGVSAEFLPHRIYAILGDNGAGKTTLLRSMAGLSRPTRGTIYVSGFGEPRNACRQIGYMAHASLLYDELSGIENLLYFAQLYGISDVGRCISSMRQVDLDPLLRRPTGQYSQGMRQRLSLARALLHDPKILLLDEPFSNVDARSTRQMVTLLASLRDSAKTLFVVTHQAMLLEGVADEFTHMEAGQIRQRSSALPHKNP